MKKIHGFKEIEKELLRYIEQDNIVLIKENGKEKKFYKPLVKINRHYENCEKEYQANKNLFLKNKTAFNYIKAEESYKKMIQAKISLIREHMFQMNNTEIKQATKTINHLTSLSFEPYKRTWKLRVSDGGGIVTEFIYP